MPGSRCRSPPPSPATKWASASANSSGARTTRSFTRPARPARWRPRRRRAACSGFRRPRCWTRSARPERRRPGSGSSCATPPIRSSCTPRRLPRTGCSPRTWRTTASPARSTSWKARRGWRPACRPTPTPRASPTGWASAGRWRKHRSSSTHPAGTRIRRPTRCCRSSAAHRLAPGDIARVTAHVHQAAIDVLGPVTDPATVHQAKFSMGTVLAAIAIFHRAGLVEFDRHFRDAAVVAFRDRVRMVHDAEVEAAYPQRWIGKVVVETTDGRVLHGRVDEPKGDPGNTLSRAELEEKALRLAEFRGGATPAEVRALCANVFSARVGAPGRPAASAGTGGGADARLRRGRRMTRRRGADHDTDRFRCPRGHLGRRSRQGRARAGRRRCDRPQRCAHRLDARAGVRLRDGAAELHAASAARAGHAGRRLGRHARGRRGQDRGRERSRDARGEARSRSPTRCRSTATTSSTR